MPADLTDLAADEALPHLLEEHGGKLYHLGLKLCGNPEDAEDLVQETFLNAFRKWDQFEGRSQASSWLYTIASRACWRKKRLKAGQPKTMPSLAELLPGEDDQVPDLRTVEEGPLDEQLRRETKEAVEAAIARLPLRFRMPLVLKEIAELSLAEVSGILGIKEATVKTRVHRARLALRKELAERLPRREAPAHDHGKRICLDLLAAKNESLDRGVPFPYSQQELCTRCRPLLATLDLAHDVCLSLGKGSLPPKLRRALLAEFRAAS